VTSLHWHLWQQLRQCCAVLCQQRWRSSSVSASLPPLPSAIVGRSGYGLRHLVARSKSGVESSIADPAGAAGMHLLCRAQPLTRTVALSTHGCMTDSDSAGGACAGATARRHAYLPLLPRFRAAAAALPLSHTHRASAACASSTFSVATHRRVSPMTPSAHIATTCHAVVPTLMSLSLWQQWFAVPCATSTWPVSFCVLQLAHMRWQDCALLCPMRSALRPCTAAIWLSGIFTTKAQRQTMRI
jgi:hypothetical protein